MADMKNLDEFQNKIASNGVYYSRIIASWVSSERRAVVPGIKIELFRGHFEDWLTELGLPEEEIREIKYLAENGKMELEDSAYKFLVRRKTEKRHEVRAYMREHRKKVIEDLRNTGHSLEDIRNALALFKKDEE